MRRYIHFAIRFYTLLLRLYPPQFRAEFGDEMAEVFAQSIHECSRRGGIALTMLLTSELRDLPFRLLQEHLAERRKRVLVSNTGVILMESGLSVQIFRFFSKSLFIVLAVFAVMVVLPFFTLGLQSQTQMEVISGALGPEAFPPYSGSANPLPKVAVLVLLAVPVWDAIFGGGLLLMLGIFWKRLSSRYRMIGVLAVLAAIIPTLFLFSPEGINLASWWMN